MRGSALIEGVGLYLEKGWAEYLTLLITGSFLPWEVFEVIRRLTWIRASLLRAECARLPLPAESGHGARSRAAQSGTATETEAKHAGPTLQPAREPFG
jgi:hypothetical protein